MGNGNGAGNLTNPMPPLSPADLASFIRFTDPPPLFLLIAPCRSGTTAMLRVFGALNMPAYFQPLKNILRWQLVGGSWAWEIPAGRPVFAKETLGPYTLAEATFNPLELLHTAGYPLDKIHLILQMRHPYPTWASWQQWWHGKTSFDLFQQTYFTAEAIRQQALELGLNPYLFIYEKFQQAPPAEVIQQFLGRLNLPYTPHTTQHWDKLPPFGSPESWIVLPEEPPTFITDHIHDPVHQATELKYVPGRFNLPPADVEAIQTAGLLTLYQKWIALAMTG